MANNEDCPIGVKLQQIANSHEADLRRLAATDTEQWAKIETLDTKLDTFKDWIGEQLRRFVPAWVTIVLMVMSGVTGSALTFAGMVLRMDSKPAATSVKGEDHGRAAVRMYRGDAGILRASAVMSPDAGTGRDEGL